MAFPLETEQGHRPVLAVYFAGVIAGGMGASVFDPTQMVGASAGVYCLLISHVPHIVMVGMMIRLDVNLQGRKAEPAL